MTATPIQAASALASIMNGGKYIKPSVLESIDGKKVEPQVVRDNVVSTDTEAQLKYMMSQATYLPKHEGYLIGGKTGTAQLLQPDGTYSQTRERGTAYGFVETGEGTYIIMVKVEDPSPQYTHFASAKTAVPIFTDTINWLINYYQPKKMN
jgi:cell division protein FtsI/penicillin-binding protein 2